MKLNIEADVQSQYSAMDVRAGVQSLRMMYKVGGHVLPVSIVIITKTSRTRGVHMSRLVEAAARNSDRDHIEDALKGIVEDVERTQENAFVRLSFEYPFRDIFAKVRISLSKNIYTYVVRVPGITACPCSKEIAGIGHMQRAWLTVALMSKHYVDIEEMVVKMLNSFSASTVEMMKRPDEGLKIVEAQDNAKFVEDVVRDASKEFPYAFFIKARSEESIHMHDAVAYIRRKKRLVPRRSI
ncbi:MAG: GTP cyclohydrolase, FolE2/MptA family [Nitrososphaerota archaeon]